MKSRENIIPGIITAAIGNSRLPVSAASCKNGAIIMTAPVNIIMDDRQRNRRRLLKGIHDLATAARLIKPTERYINAECRTYKEKYKAAGEYGNAVRQCTCNRIP